MNILNPIALLFALLAIPIILLYILRLQRREQKVSSTLLWRQVVLDREANTLWQKLRRNLLLILQLATLAFLVFALLRPYISLPGGLNGRLIVLMDASASMRATDVLPSRFDAAKEQARNLISGMGVGDEMSLILVDSNPRALTGITSDRSELLAALDASKASLGQANWAAAISLGSATANEQSTFIVISDGAHAEDLKLLQRQTRFVPIGVNGDNLSISTLSLRKTSRGLAAFVRVTNNGKQDDDSLVSLRADNGTLLDARTVKIPAGQSISWTINDIDANTASVRASIDKASHNNLAADDVVYAVSANTALRRALLVTRGNRFLEQALSNLPNIQVSRAVTTGVTTLDSRPFDVYILDSMNSDLSALPPRANVLFIGPQQVFTATDTFSNTGYVRTVPHPIAQSLNWRNVSVQATPLIEAPAWLKPVIQSQGGPLLLAGEFPAELVGKDSEPPLQRVVVLPFELRRSDLPLQLAFPILMLNSIEWLAPPQGMTIPASVKPGEVVNLPRGAQVSLPDTGALGGTTVIVDQRGFANTDALGPYAVTFGDVSGAFAVNFFNSIESEITPSPQLVIGEQKENESNILINNTLSQRELWRWLAALALLVLFVEWWIYQRGVPSLKGLFRR
ncbi:MAG: VWA domain-containing protein [Chloroflexota bacterium]|jgi:hypothetical protein